MPRFLVLLHGDKESESGVPPSKEILSQMHAYNASLMTAGVMLGGEGLHATSKGARVCFPGPDPTNPSNNVAAPEDITTTSGPFEYPMENPKGINGDPKRPFCGFWIFKTKDLEEALAWIKKAPLRGTFVEVREIFEMSDMPDIPEGMQEEEEAWRKELEGKK